MRKRKGDFEGDIWIILKKLSQGLDGSVKDQLYRLGKQLIEQNHRRHVKINHSVMELICCKQLLLTGYQVGVEKPLDANLICDVYAVKGEGVLILEVETGYTPPTHALDPYTFNQAKISSKISRYSPYASKFGLATPNYNILQIPYLFSRPPRDRSEREVEQIRRLCDIYYSRPPISAQQIRDARLHSIQLINVDHCHTREVDPETYQELLSDVERVVTYSWKWKNSDPL